MMPNGKVLIALMTAAASWAIFHMCYAFFFRPDTQILNKRNYDLGSKDGNKGKLPVHLFVFDKHYVTKEHQDRITEDYVKRGQYN